MYSQSKPLRLFCRQVCACVIGLLMTSGFPAAMAASNSDSCSLLNPSDLTALLGGKVTAKDNAGACVWTVAGSQKKLIATRMRATGPGAEMAYMGARMNASDGGTVKVSDESGIGDKAFAVMPSFGIAMFMLKHGQLLQLQYWTGATGTSKDLDALRPVAKKAIAAF